MTALTNDDVMANSGVEHGDLLLAFADAIVGDDAAVLADAREAVVATLGPEAMVDAAGVAANFERMVRIADSTGIQLDDRMAALSKEVREELQLQRFIEAKTIS